MPCVTVEMEMVTLILWKKGFSSHSLSGLVLAAEQQCWKVVFWNREGLATSVRFFPIISLFLRPEFVLLDSKGILCSIYLVELIQLITFHLCPTEHCTHPCVCVNKSDTVKTYSSCVNKQCKGITSLFFFLLLIQRMLLSILSKGSLGGWVCVSTAVWDK